MACPQKENGFTPIANEVLEKLILFPFPHKTGIPLALCMFVIRKTWGYNKKIDNISLTQFQKGLDSNRPTIVHWLQYLVKANILVKGIELDKKGYSYSFNKDYDTWAWLVKASELVKARTYTSKGALTSTSKGALTHKRNIKDNNKRHIATNVAGDTSNKELEKQVGVIIKALKDEINPLLDYKNKTQRASCKNLINTKGFENILMVIEYYKRVKDKPFCPQVYSPWDLEKKLPALEKFIENN